MNVNRIVAVAGLLFASIADGQASSTLAAGGVYGGPSQAYAFCYIFNAGKGYIQFKKLRLLSEDGTSPDLGGTCWPTPHQDQLGPRETCNISAPIASNQTYSCQVVIAGSKKDVRGTLDIRKSDQTVLTNSPLR